MMNYYYTELRRINEDMKTLRPLILTQKHWEDILQGYQGILELSSLARKEGLLAIDEDNFDYSKYPLGDYLKRLIMCVVDGAESEEIEERGMTLYASSNHSNIDRLLLLVYLNGCLSIKNRENPRIMGDKLEAMIPKKILAVYKEREKRKAAAEESKSKPEISIVDRLCEGESPINPTSEYYLPVKMAESAFKSMDDRSIQRFLRDVDNSDLAIFLKGISGEGRRSIFNNLSIRLGIMIAEDMEFMGPVRIKDIAEAAQKVIRILMRLIACGEIIADDNNDYLRMLDKVYNSGSEGSEETYTESERTESELEQVFNEYLSLLERRI
ncbi:MAG: hypothetical protein E7298_00070 [Lachnospiraceae bacterium]|nr:hypothetical protein [Lachnospiraceae bacterium]